MSNADKTAKSQSKELKTAKARVSPPMAGMKWKPAVLVRNVEYFHTEDSKATLLAGSTILVNQKYGCMLAGGQLIEIMVGEYELAQ